ncbi:MAG: type I restriction-modification system subunit M [Mycoplasma sp.]
MSQNKEQVINHKNELFRGIWKIANELRGSIDGWDFKQYVLIFLFYRFLSEKFVNQCLQYNVNYLNLSDEEATKDYKETFEQDLGYFIKPSQLFVNVVKNCDYNDNLNTDIADIFENINKSFNERLKGIFESIRLDDNRLGNTTKSKNEYLRRILKSINGINFKSFSDHEIDIFGDAYEFLMAQYASAAGKSGGEFFTPQEVSKLLAKISLLNVKEDINHDLSVYDPACGSSSLLIQVYKQLKDKSDVSFYGQEINHTTYNLSRINMFLHNVQYDMFDIEIGDTLFNDRFEKKKFDIIVSNPPYSTKWKASTEPWLKTDPRFSPVGVLPPDSKADMAFVLHSLYHLDKNGIAAIVCFPGIFYRGGVESKIRSYLLESVEAVIQLPKNLFYGTSIDTCILVLNKNKKSNEVIFVDASNEFLSQPKQNKLSEQNINKILELYQNKDPESKLVKVVSHKEIEESDFNLSVKRYVASNQEQEVIDIDKLNQEVNEIETRVQSLRESINEIVKKITAKK